MTLVDYRSTYLTDDYPVSVQRVKIIKDGVTLNTLVCTFISLVEGSN